MLGKTHAHPRSPQQAGRGDSRVRSGGAESLSHPPEGAHHRNRAQPGSGKFQTHTSVLWALETGKELGGTGSCSAGTALPHIPSQDETVTVTTVLKKPLCVIILRAGGAAMRAQPLPADRSSSKPQFPHLGQPLELL